jgi:hypothetical protein
VFRGRYPVKGLNATTLITLICRPERNGSDLKQHMSTRAKEKGGEKGPVKFMIAQVI